jgi:hypothetical protein
MKMDCPRFRVACSGVWESIHTGWEGISSFSFVSAAAFFEGGFDGDAILTGVCV